MRVGGGGLAIALGFVILWAVTQGYTKNLAAAWNALIAGGAAGSGSSANLSAGALSLPPITIPQTSIPLPVIHTSFPTQPGGAPAGAFA